MLTTVYMQLSVDYSSALFICIIPTLFSNMSGEVERYTAIREGRGEVLFPPELDFTRACSCPECLAKISALKCFEEEIKYYKDEVYQRKFKLGDAIEHSSMILTFLNCMSSVLVFLREKLKALHEELGETYARNTIKDAYERVENKTIEAGLLPPITDDGYDDCETPIISSLAEEIEYAIFICKNNQFPDEARSILLDILNIEHGAEAVGGNLDPVHVMMQIEKLMKLPEIMEREIYQLIADVADIIKKGDMLHRAEEIVCYTYHGIIGIRN